jgi:putative glycosyltransferase (TIGR04348 family)
MARLVLVTPYAADANNGNARTAVRWARLLRPWHRVDVCTTWDGRRGDALVALHARRSAGSVLAWSEAMPRRPIVVVMTGTDLNADLPAGDADAHRSVQLADRVVVLHPRAVGALPTAARGRACVVQPSCAARMPVAKPDDRLRVVVVGHLRDEKSPRTVFEAVRQVAVRPDIRIDLIGRALDPELGAQALALAGTHPAFRWLGGLPHGTTRRRIQHAHLLWNPSRSEGAPTVVVEALRSGTPVVASAIDGHRGLLGDDWPALHAVGDAAAAAALLLRARDDPGWSAALMEQAARLADRFDPAVEQAALRAMVDRLLAAPGRPCVDPATMPAAPVAQDRAAPTPETSA